MPNPPRGWGYKERDYTPVDPAPSPPDLVRANADSGRYVRINQRIAKGVRTQSNPDYGAVQKDIRIRNAQVVKNLQKTAREIAGSIQMALRTNIEVAYRQGTGRMARGIRVKVTNTTEGANLTVTMINYREANFITQLAQYPHWGSFPIPAYTIFARGAYGAELGEQNESPNFRSEAFRTRVRHMTGTRLKVPYMGSIAYRKNRGGESVTAAPATADGSASDYYYPLWVHHPGFPRDVIAETLQAEGDFAIQKYKGSIALSWNKLGDLKAGLNIASPEITGSTKANSLIGYAKSLQTRQINARYSSPKYIRSYRPGSDSGIGL